MPKTASRSDVAQELFNVFHAVRRATLEKFNEEGLSFARAKVLWALLDSGPMRAGSLAEGLDCSAATATELVDALVRDGYAARTPDPKDRRAVLVDLTVTGRDLAEATAAQKRRILEEAFDCLSAEQVEQLRCVLRELAGSPMLQGGNS